jgi:Domain of unknown function (DUF4202)
MADSPYIEAGKKWVAENYPYNSYHLLKSLEWLDRIAPGSSEALRVATLTHDMERAFPGPDQPVAGPGQWSDPEYNAAHAARSARIVAEWLSEQGADETLVAEVRKLVKAHEVGGWTEANLLQAADSLSFLETNIDLFLGFARSRKRTLDEVNLKFDDSYERIQVEHARELALPMYQTAKARLSALQAEMLETPQRSRE